MTILIARRLEDVPSIGFCVYVSQIFRDYPVHVKDATRMLVIINNVYNTDGKIVHKPQESLTFDIKQDPGGFYYYLDMTSYVRKLGIPMNYTIEFLATNLIIRDEVIPLYPNELRTDISTPLTKLDEQIRENVRLVEKVSRGFETIGLLSQSGFHREAAELMEGLARFEKGDPRAITYFRNVIEGLRKSLDKANVNDEARTDLLKRYLSASYALVSNFGEHIGTSGLLEEANLAKDIAVEASQYVTTKLAKRPVSER